MDKQVYNSSWYNGRSFIVVEVPFPMDCESFHQILVRNKISYDSRVNPETGAPVYILFTD